MISLNREGPIFILAMQAGENRFNRGFVNALNGALDEIEGSRGPAALVTTGTDKFFSNGLDLDWLMGAGASEGPGFIPDFLALLGRFLALPVPSAAAINGHAFAGGGMFALTQDFRVMRADRGFFCLPEIDLSMPLAPGMNGLITAKLGIRVATDLLLTGRRIGGEEAVRLGVIDAAVAADQVLPQALARVEPLAAKDRATYGALKRGLFGPAIDLLAGGAIR
jgi:enoyl-CoA hydratase/carnithine racemase